MELLNGDRLATFEYTPGSDPKVAPARRAAPGDTLPFATDAKLTLPNGAAPVDWTPFLFGFVPFAAAMAVAFCFFTQAVVAGDPPGFVW